MANIVNFEELYTKEFNTHIFNAAKQYWNIQNCFSCIDAPKKNDMFLFLNGCVGEYTTYDGKVFIAPKKSIIYAPKNSRYSFRCLEVDEDTFQTIIINFNLLDEDGEIFSLSDEIKIMDDLNIKRFEMMFSSLTDISSQNIRFPSALRLGFYKIITELCTHFHKQNIFSSKFQVISNGILYLEESDNINISVSKIAKMCNVSEIYFRKLFKEYSGFTPSQFKINKKIERAKQYLAFENKTIKETADALGFNEVAYFCRVFKEKTGLTPGEYIKKAF
ncbi:MAG: AraC family transcriptional regulator [Ruminococcaceae bacterium]|nr:AraC family transcriptional regulator [Oscillospiraceae bacterium]